MFRTVGPPRNANRGDSDDTESTTGGVEALSGRRLRVRALRRRVSDHEHHAERIPGSRRVADAGLRFHRTNRPRAQRLGNARNAASRADLGLETEPQARLDFSIREESPETLFPLHFCRFLASFASLARTTFSATRGVQNQQN